MNVDFGDCEEVGGPQYALNLYTLAESIHAMTVLEIGAGWGWSARAFALSMRNRMTMGCGSCEGIRLISIDPHPERIKPENRGRIAALEVPWEVRKERSGDVPFNSTIDLLYIDGDPKNAADDFRRYAENVRDGGLIVLDGYGGQPGPTEFVDASWQERDFLKLPYSTAYCHAIHRKPVPLGVGKYEARCTSCPQTFSAGVWSTLDALIDTHVGISGHSVEAVAGPHNIRYIRGSK